MGAPKGHKPYPGCEKGGETGGRPKVYTADFIDNEAKELEKWNKKEDSMFIQQFCLERGYSVWKISDFVKESKRFRQAYDIWRTKQQMNLMAGGLKKKYAHPMCALMLSHIHDIHLKTESKISGDEENPLAFFINQANGASKDLVSDDQKSS